MSFYVTNEDSFCESLLASSLLFLFACEVKYALYTQERAHHHHCIMCFLHHVCNVAPAVQTDSTLLSYVVWKISECHTSVKAMLFAILHAGINQNQIVTEVGETGKFHANSCTPPANKISTEMLFVPTASRSKCSHFLPVSANALDITTITIVLSVFIVTLSWQRSAGFI